MKVLFDNVDREIFNEIALLENESEDSSTLPFFIYSSHAEGIIEVAVAVEVRVATAVYFLMNSTPGEEYMKRIKALQRLFHDVCGVEKGLRLNAARVLVEIMKEILAFKGNAKRRLELIRDFREVYTGKPGIVRRHLKSYQLLEVPEDQSQLSFDDNVDNASKLGKKNPSHLILDAWIKGIRKFQVINKNFITHQVAYELLAAAEILGVEVEIGIEFPVFYNNKFINIVWTPLGVSVPSAFLRLMKSSAVDSILEIGKHVDSYHQKHILDLLEVFNKKVKEQVETEYSISFGKLDSEFYLKFLEGAAPNEVTLSEFIFSSIKEQINDNKLIPEMILLKYLKPLSISMNIKSDLAQKYGSVAEDVKGLVKLLNTTSGMFRLTLLTSNLHSWEMPDILYMGRGQIDAIEIFNLRDYILAGEGIIKYGDGRINQFRKAVNERDISRIKSMLSEDIVEVEQLEINNREEVVAALQKVRRNIGKLLDRYSGIHIEPAVGSGAAGRGKLFYGMGLVVKQSLRRGVARFLSNSEPSEHLALPLGCQVYKRVEFLSGGKSIKNYWQRFLAWHERRREWVRQTVKEVAGKELDSNIYTLSGRFGEERVLNKYTALRYWWEYLNTDVKNIIKILIGFIPAFLTFYLTAEWSVLKYGGGLIWFAITGGRNVLQLVLSAGGFDRNLNLRWSSLVDKKRIAESLMYTGLSVPLLEYLVKNLLLQQVMDVNAAVNPLVAYAVISGVNGLYISLHNYIRGFPWVAIIGNLFRSILAVPISILISSLLFEGLNIMMVTGVAMIISQWSVVISKIASDIVACLIEGLADRAAFINLRRREIKELEMKFLQLCERLELLLPNKHLADILLDIPDSVATCKRKNSTALEELVFVVLDMMYFWYNKPRSRKIIKKNLFKVSRVEKELFRNALNILMYESIVYEALLNFGTGRQVEVVLEYYNNYNERFTKGFTQLLDL